jgi:hypothetical protein
VSSQVPVEVELLATGDHDALVIGGLTGMP